MRSTSATWAGKAVATSAPPDLSAELHAAYDNRPLWRKVLGLEPADLSPQLQQYLGQQKQAAQQQIQSQLQGVYSGYGQGAAAGAKTIPFIVAPPLLGEAAATAAGGGAVALGANMLTQGLTSAAIAKTQGANTPEAATVGALGAVAPVWEAALPAAGAALEQSAQKQYGQVLGATTKGNKYLSQTQVVPGLLERQVTAMSLKGLQATAAENVQKFGQLIDDAWTNLPAGTTAELNPVLNSLDQSAKDALTIQTPTGPKPTTTYAQNALNTVDYMKQLLADVAQRNPQTGVMEIPVDKVRQLRQVWDDVAAQAKVY